MTSFKKFIPLLLLFGILTGLIQTGCDELITERIFITEAGHPVAEFELDSLSSDIGCAPHTVTFLDKSQGPRDQWLWTFGDGDSSSDTNPVHIYDSTGLYTVILQIWDSELDGFGQITKKRFIFIDTSNADFTINNDSVCTGDEFTFTPALFGPNRTYSWDFGDSSTISTDSIATHIYDSAGAYEVALTVNGNCGDFTTFNTIYSAPCPTVHIAADATTGCVPFTITFTDTSTPYDGYVMLPASSTWDFGDNTPDGTGGSIDHIYTSAGVYTVTLTTVSDGGQKTDSIVDYITVYDSVAADFISIGEIIACYDPLGRHQIKFISRSQGNIDSLVWDFDDGSTSVTNDTMIIHTYINPGRYDVTLKAYGACAIEDTLPSLKNEPNYVVIYNELLNSDLSFLIRYDSIGQHPDSTESLTDTVNYTFYGFESYTPGIIDSTVWTFIDTVLSDTLFHKVGNAVSNIFMKTSNTHEMQLKIYNYCGSIGVDSTFNPFDSLPPVN